MFGSLISLLTGGVLDRVLDSVDRKFDRDADREKLKADLVKEHLRTRSEWMRAGGFWLMMLFALPLAFWHGMVIYDSALGCADCVWANDWTVAALPPPLDEWAGLIIISIFGVLGVSRLRR